MFKKRKGIHISYNKQGIIYFTCVDFKNQPEEVQTKIKCLCRNISEKFGEKEEILFKFLTDDKVSATSLSLKYFVPEKKLYRMRKEFYEKW